MIRESVAAVAAAGDVVPSGLPATVPPLRSLYFYLTAGCNLACRHCWLGPRYTCSGDPGALPVTLFARALAEARPLGLDRVKLTGGEPLLHPEFPTLVAQVRAANLALQFETNATLLTVDVALLLATLPRRHVAVSLDGATAATHEAVRGVPGCFAEALRGIEYLRAAGIAPQVIFSLQRCNVDEISAIVRLAEEVGASSLKFNIVQPMSRGETLHEQDQALTVAEYVERGRWVESDLAARTRLPLHYDYPMAFRPLSRIASKGSVGVCRIETVLGVLPQGNYALCGIGEQRAELTFGRVGEASLVEVWSRHPLLQSLRAGLPERLEGVCGHCVHRTLCRGACVAQNYYSSGHLWAAHWFCREAQRANLFPITRLDDVEQPGGSKAHVTRSASGTGPRWHRRRVRAVW